MEVLEISWKLIPLILLVVFGLLFFILNGFRENIESENSMIFGFIFILLVIINFIFYGVWGLYWLVTHIKIV